MNMERKRERLISFNTNVGKSIADVLLVQGKVRINGFGVFTLKRMASKKGFNPAKGKYEVFPSYVKVVFFPNYKFKKSIQRFDK